MLLSFSNTEIYNEPMDVNNFETLNSNETHIIEKWYFSAVKSTLNISSVPSDDQSIADFLNIHENQVKQCMQLYIKFGEVIQKNNRYILNKQAHFFRYELDEECQMNMVKNGMIESIQRMSLTKDTNSPPAEFVGAVFFNH